MADLAVTDAAVEAAARAYYATVRTRVRMPDFDDLPESTRKLAFSEARAALEAALPHLRPNTEATA